MGYRPPKGVRPPQLEGRRTGRPKGSKNYAGAWEAAWADARWGYEHRAEDDADPPTQAAQLWWYFAHYFPDELEAFLGEYGRL